MPNSLWVSYSDVTNYPILTSALNIDVAIIGGGICGLTTAQLLSREGYRVAVFEKGKVGLSSTGYSTGNLYAAMGEVLIHVKEKFDESVMRKVVDARLEGVDFIEENVNTLNIDCDFRTVRWHNYNTPTGNPGKIRKAMDAGALLELDYREEKLKNLPFNVTEGFSLSGAAQFNPLRYVQGLAAAIVNDDCLIFENTEIRGIHEEDSSIQLITDKGVMIKAGYVIHSSHTPKGISTYHTMLGPYREYGVACKIKGSHPEGVFFGYFDSSDITSTRTYERNGETFLIAVGSPHKVGHGNSSEYLQKMERFVHEHFNVEEITHRWGAQNYKAPDYLPFIGKKSLGSRQYMASGFSSHGLTYGTVAALILSDQLTGKFNPYSDLFKPVRFHPVKAAPKFIKENVDVAYQYVKDYFFARNPKNFEDIKPDTGEVVDENGHKLAVCKDANGGVRVCSAVCTHLGGIVHWNSAEKSWDCPIHGSRFETNGAVIEGPALLPLTTQAEELQKDETAISDDKVDQSSLESFPASDPPAHHSGY